MALDTYLIYEINQKQISYHLQNVTKKWMLI